jgi:hypothetical protein
MMAMGKHSGHSKRLWLAVVAIAVVVLVARPLAAHYGKLSGGGGGISSVVADGQTINGTGTIASPLSGIPATETTPGTMSAADKLAANTKDWQAAMFAFARSKYSTINRGFIVPFSQGSGVDYQSGGVNGSGTLTLSTTVAQDVTMATGTTAGSGVGIVGKGAPVIITAVTTQPWLVAVRCKNTTTADATTLSVVDPTNAGTTFTVTRPLFGIIGTSSTAFYTFQVTSSNKMVTSVAVDNSVYHDFAMGFNGSTTLTAYFGDVVAGTLTNVASSTDLSGLGAGTGTPAALIFNSGTTNMTFDCTRIGAWTTQP